MQKRLIDAHLWNSGDGELNEQNYSNAWRVLARLGTPYRFGGRAFDGSYEYLILHPKSGSVIATGRGESTQRAMFEAALAAQQVLAHEEAAVGI